MTDRDRFENYLWDTFPFEPISEVFNRNENGVYLDRDTRFAWEVWQAAKADASKGIPVEECLPETLTPVLAFGVSNSNSKTYLWMRAKYVAKYSLEEPDIDYTELNCDYDETKDTYYQPEGWYELIDNWDDYEAVIINDYTITHWQPLPPDPNSEVES